MRTRMFAALCSTASLLVAITAGAQELEDKRFYIAPSATYTMFDSDTNLQDELGYQLLLGKPLTPHWNLELYGFGTTADTDTTPSTEVDIEGIGLTGLYFFNRETLPFYGLLGAAKGNIDSGTTDVDANFYDLGVGFLRQLNDYGVAFRAEYRFRRTDPDVGNHANDNVLSFGFQIPLGAPPEKVAPPSPPPPPPPPPLPPPPPVEEPKPTEPIVLKGVNFEFDSARLTPEAKTALNEVSAMLKDTPGTKLVLVMGHTCNIGSDDYNHGLSHRRADSVKAYLVSTGIDAGRLQTKGYGESRPLTSNETEEGRIQNRRVELKMLDNDPCIPPAKGDSVDERGCVN